MLRNIDTEKLNTLFTANNDAKVIITQLMANHYEIVSLLAHEIRNSMTLVSSTSQLIELKNPEVRRIKNWVHLRDDIDFVCRLIGEISSLLGRGSLKGSSFSIGSLLKNVALSFAITLNHEKPLIEFTSEISPGLGEFKGDAMKLEEVVLNLLINAKESIKGAGRIKLKATQDQNHITICVEDTGCGISGEQKSVIFDPFITFKSNGTGLGLPFCKKVIEAHKGSIDVKSALNKGSVFTVLLPV